MTVLWRVEPNVNRGGSRIFFRRRCTRLLLYFFFFCRIPVVLENRRSSQGGAHPLHPPPRSASGKGISYGSPTKPIRYKRVCEQNVFCYRDFRSYLKANHPKLLPFALKSTLAFEIHWMMLSLLRCLSLPSPSLRAELNFKSGFSL